MNSLAASWSTALMHHFDWIVRIVKQSINHACHKAACGGVRWPLISKSYGPATDALCGATGYSVVSM